MSGKWETVKNNHVKLKKNCLEHLEIKNETGESKKYIAWIVK